MNQTVNLDSSVGLKVLQLRGANTNGRFGSAVATLDFNLDGILDIVVSAPGVDMEDMDYYGQVINLLGLLIVCSSNQAYYFYRYIFILELKVHQLNQSRMLRMLMLP